MTQKAAIIKALLEGKVLSTMEAFHYFACTNLSRELGRSVIREFNVEISKDRVNFISKYGQHGFYFRYRMKFIPQNAEGIKKMVQYIAENDPSAIMVTGIKTDKIKTK